MGEYVKYATSQGTPGSSWPDGTISGFTALPANVVQGYGIDASQFQELTTEEADYFVAVDYAWLVAWVWRPKWWKTTSISASATSTIAISTDETATTTAEAVLHTFDGPTHPSTLVAGHSEKEKCTGFRAYNYDSYVNREFFLDEFDDINTVDIGTGEFDISTSSASVGEDWAWDNMIPFGRVTLTMGNSTIHIRRPTASEYAGFANPACPPYMYVYVSPLSFSAGNEWFIEIYTGVYLAVTPWTIRPGTTSVDASYDAYSTSELFYAGAHTVKLAGFPDVTFDLYAYTEAYQVNVNSELGDGSTIPGVYTLLSTWMPGGGSMSVNYTMEPEAYWEYGVEPPDPDV